MSKQILFRKEPYLAALASVFLTACGMLSSSSSPDAHLIPDEPGLYAVVEARELVRLDGDREWENKTWQARSMLDADTSFVVHNPALRTVGAAPDEAVGLYRVAWVRSRISGDGIMPNTGSRWNVSTSEHFRVPTSMRYVSDLSDVIHLVPEQPLQPGLYSLRLDMPVGRQAARLGVQWQVIDHDRYAAGHCVDEYVDTGGRHLEFLRCDEQRPMVAANDLRVHLVNPRMETVGGTTRLVVQGVVVNTSSEQTRGVPPLTAAVRSAGGEVLREWSFETGMNELEPGASVPFETALENPPTGTQTVNVGFSPSLSARN